MDFLTNPIPDIFTCSKDLIKKELRIRLSPTVIFPRVDNPRQLYSKSLYCLRTNGNSNFTKWFWPAVRKK